jgi:hypothetical protein
MRMRLVAALLAASAILAMAASAYGHFASAPLAEARLVFELELAASAAPMMSSAASALGSESQAARRRTIRSRSRGMRVCKQ